jgi:hypothetical protein
MPLNPCNVYSYFLTLVKQGLYFVQLTKTHPCLKSGIKLIQARLSATDLLVLTYLAPILSSTYATLTIEIIVLCLSLSASIPSLFRKAVKKPKYFQRKNKQQLQLMCSCLPDLSFSFLLLLLFFNQQFKFLLKNG